jgi:hypothetical protein
LIGSELVDVAVGVLVRRARVGGDDGVVRFRGAPPGGRESSTPERSEAGPQQIIYGVSTGIGVPSKSVYVLGGLVQLPCLRLGRRGDLSGTFLVVG